MSIYTYSKPPYISTYKCSNPTVVMERVNKKSQLVKMFLLLSFLSFLLLLIPFISPPLRSPYLYFLLNLLIISLAVEAGLLASILKPHVHDEKRKAIVVARKEEVAYVVTRKKEVVEDYCNRDTNRVEERASIADKSMVAKAAERVKKLKRCPSRPSIFFIGSCDGDLVEEDRPQQVVVVAEEEMGELSNQELFAKAEMFIGNFHKQLKMQREESWKKLHGLYHRAF